MKKLCMLILALAVVVGVGGAVAAEPDRDGEAVIREVYDAMDKQDWDRYYKQFSTFEQETLAIFLKDQIAKDEHLGLFNVTSVDLIDVKEFDLKDADTYTFLKIHSYLSRCEYIYGMSAKIRAFLITFDMGVIKECEFSRNGFDARMEFLVYEDGHWKSAGSTFAADALIEAMYPEESRSADVSMLLELIHLRYNYNFWGNMEGEIIYVGGAGFLPCKNFKNTGKSYTEGLFTDVDENLWYGKNHEAAVSKVYEMGIMEGVGENRFIPEGSLTVAEAIKMAAVVHKTFTNGNGEFNYGSPWYQVYVDYAVENHIITDGLFNDFDRKITRAEMARVFSHALPDGAYPGINTIESIPDVDRNTKYTEDIYLLYNAGVIIGNDKNKTFLPDALISRAEAAMLIVRVADPTQRIFSFVTEA